MQADTNTSPPVRDSGPARLSETQRRAQLLTQRWLAADPLREGPVASIQRLRCKLVNDPDAMRRLDELEDLLTQLGVVLA